MALLLSFVNLVSLPMLNLPLAAAAPVTGQASYTPLKNKLCDGYPQVQISSINGTCLGLMVNSTQGLRMPRYAAQLSNGVILVTDMGTWDFGKGTVWAITESVDAQGNKKTEVINLFPKTVMTYPNGIAIDDQDRVYIGTPMGILRFSALKNNQIVLDPPLETVISDFAQSEFRKNEYESKISYKTLNHDQPKLHNKHPLVNFVFDSNFRNLYVNIGAPSDNCSYGYVTNNAKGFCEQTEGKDVAAAIYHYEVNLNTPKPEILKKEVFARGLRNSMALVLNENSGYLLQGENSRDYTEVDRPDEELNLVQMGGHYGWPYCYSDGKVATEYQTVVTPQDCLGQKYMQPLVLLPPHSAPLSMLYNEDKLYITYHGYKDTGHKIVSFDVDTNTGLPTSKKSQDLVYNWNSKEGVRPMGSPVGLLKLKDGSILIVEDKNKTLLRLSSGSASGNDATSEGNNNTPIVKKVWKQSELDSLQELRDKYFSNNCSTCHSEVFAADLTTQQVADQLYKMSFVGAGSFSNSKLFYKLDQKLMPPPEQQPNLSDSDRKDIINKMTKLLEAK